MARSVIVDLKAKTRQYERAMDRATKSTGGLSQSLAKIGKGAAIGGAAAIAVGVAAIGTAAIKVGIESAKAFGKFETSLSRIEGLVGVPKAELAEMTTELKLLAVETAKGPQELADALFFITSAGLEGAEAMDALEVSARAATAGLGDTSTIADVVTSAMNAYGDSMGGAAVATDVLVATVREGKAEAPALAQAMGRVIPIASKMGISFDQVGASIAAMTRVGLDANEASTALRSIMTSLLKPGADASRALEEVGLSAAGLREEIRNKGLFSALTSMTTAFEGQDDATVRVFGNVRALTGVMALMGDNAAATEQIFADLAVSTGALDSAFGAAADTGAFAFEQAKTRIEVALLEVGEKILPQLADAMDTIAPMLPGVVEGFGELAIVMINLAEKGLPGVIGFLSGMDDQLLRSSLKWFDMRMKIQDTINVLNHLPLVEFSDTFNAADREMREWIITQQKVSIAIGQGVTPINVATRALLEMAEKGTLTKDRYNDLQGVLGLTTGEMVRATDSVLEHAAANGLDWAETDRLTNASEEGRVAIQNLWMEQQQAGEIARFHGAASRWAADNVDALGEAHVSAAGGVTTIITPLGIVSNALRELVTDAKGVADALLTLTNPTFKAVKAVEGLATAEAALAKEEKKRVPNVQKLAELQLGVVKATLETQSALDALGFNPANLEGSIASIQSILGLSRDEAIGLLQTLGVLDDQGNIVVKFELQTSVTGPLAGTGAARFLPEARAKGGPVNAGTPYIVGEEGPEMFTPSRSGSIIPNSSISNIGGNKTINLEVHGSDNPAQDGESLLLLAQIGGI